MPQSVRDELASIICDFDALIRSYESGGILLDAASAPGAAAFGGTRDERLHFRRLCYFAGGLLRNAIAPAFADNGDAALHVSVFGGTQVGKSTIVNLLLGAPAAGVSHVASFTQHSQAFTLPSLAEEDLFASEYSFQTFTRVQASEIATSGPMCYSVTREAGFRLPRKQVLWDTPDCDSVNASGYLPGLAEAITLADALIYVTSREKYAVLAVIEWLKLLLEAGTPVTAVLNMTPAAQQDDISGDMAKSLGDLRDASDGVYGEPVAIGFYPEGIPRASSEIEAAAETIHSRVNRSLAMGSRRQRAGSASRFLARHIPTLLVPAIAELEAKRDWDSHIEEVIELFVTEYQRTYLDDPERYDAFNRVSLEILSLLNPPIPGLQKTIAGIRQIVGLPARALLQLIRTGWYKARSSPAPAKRIPGEIVAFRHARDIIFNVLGQAISRNLSADRHHPFWDSADSLLRAETVEIETQFQQGLEEHLKLTEERIRKTASDIYGELKKQPVKLNLLRTGRLSADAAAIVVSIKSGGHGDILHDVIVAPILMSLVETVAQQLAGNYVDETKAALRQQLLEDVRGFAADLFVPMLDRIGDSAMQKSGFLRLKPASVESLASRVQNIATEFMAAVR
jgi:hypothetical protein